MNLKSFKHVFLKIKFQCIAPFNMLYFQNIRSICLTSQLTELRGNLQCQTCSNGIKHFTGISKLMK